MEEEGIAVEMNEEVDEWGVDMVTKIVNSIYDRGQRPDAMKRSILYTIPRKPVAVECDKFRTVSIMSQLSKIVLRIVLDRNKNKIISEFGEDNYGSMKRKRMSNIIFVLGIISERAIEMKKDIFLCSIDYEKAFDTVRHKDLLSVLSRIQIGRKEIRIIRNLYYDQTAAVRVGGELADWVKIESVVMRGCVNLLSLFMDIL